MTIQTFADAERVLAASLPGYAPRPQQQKLAGAVEELFASDGTGQLLAQAGCGVGKSLGAAIPAILSGRRMLYATATKALQEQIAGKDIPFLREHLGIDFTWALLKGRSNYVCVAKMAEATTLDLPNIEAIRDELEDPEHSGDFEHLANQVPADKKYLLSMSSAECPGKSECPFADACFAEKAKAVAKEADLVITNTAMLMTDLRITQLSDGKVQMLGEYEGVVIDEAHELPEIAAGALADNFRRRGMEIVVSGAENFITQQNGPDVGKLTAEIRDQIDKIWFHLEELARGEQVELKISELEANIEPYVVLVESLEALLDELSSTQIKVGNVTNEATRQRRIARRIISLRDRLREFILSEGIVRWVETEEMGRGRNRRTVATLKYSPIEVGPFLNEFLWSKVPVALVSATLSVGTDFGYITRELGLNDPITLDVGTPFDYATQARLFIPDKNQPSPSPKTRSAWFSYAQATTRSLVEAAGGGALLLYTSRKAMQNAYALLGPVLEDAGYTCLMQGEHGTNKEIAKRFAEDEHSVLFALKSFFTGVDFAGNTCRLVVIDKLPFPVPSDIMFNAKANLIERRYGARSAFDRLSIPMMTLTLVQGFGRLIRSVQDRGVVAILDSRLDGMGYGKKIVRSLPDAPVVHKIDEVAGFYAA